MNLSYWEMESWLTGLDYCVVGSGITGLSCALELRRLHPSSRILVLERGVLPQGASTRNAGFACFGSLTEILDDLRTHSEEEVIQLVGDRYRGIGLLRERLGDDAIGYMQYGGFEVFPEADALRQEQALDEMGRINRMLRPVFGRDCFEVRENRFGLKGVLPALISNPLEGQLDTGQMMKALLARVAGAGIPVLSGVRFKEYRDQGAGVAVITDAFEFETRKLLIATNGFASGVAGPEIAPARAQVLVTEPVPGLELRGSFHLEAGYYYFRNIGERVLLGGGRNLDKAGETTEEFGQTPLIQQRLETLLREVILPGRTAAITHRWSGIMGVGPQKKPILRHLSPNVACGVRLGGMGVAIGSHTGASLAQLALNEKEHGN